ASRHPLPGERAGVRGLSLGAALVGTVALLGSGLYVDRYSLDSAWSLAIFLPLVIPWRRAKLVAITSLIIIAIFSTYSVAEYHAWNGARWKAVAELRARGIPITDIDGGAEVWSLYELSHADQRFRRIHQFGLPPRPYLIAFEPMRGYRVVGKYPFTGWLGLHRGVIYLLSSRA
ncbi:MAG TPA: hypothetical protein VGA33_11065, partial [Thermoanaerobaculia bacterium]